MLNLFTRGLVSVDQRLVLLAPEGAAIPSSLQNVEFAPGRHREWLDQLQRLRGDLYLRDGALKANQLTGDGRHQTPEDDKSWHLLVTDGSGVVDGCIWYLEHEHTPSLHELRVGDCPLVSDAAWRQTLQAAIENEVGRARRESVRYAEVGGWAVACRSRCLSAGLLLILGTYSLSQLTGGALVLAMATVRNSSAKILRRLGGSHLEADGCAVPPYYDPRYECMMELLRFDTRRPALKYAETVERLKAHLANVQVIVGGNPFVTPSSLDVRFALPANVIPAYPAAWA
jgi:hypothetical protein